MPRSSSPPAPRGDALRERVLEFDPDLALERAWTPPADWYYDAELYALEQRALLRRSWLAVGRAECVSAPGSYLATQLLGEPVLIVRDADAVLRAFYNVCRHHAARMLSGEGSCAQIVCPYHGWTYAHSGRLARAPGLGALDQVERGALDLVPIAVAEFGPLLLLCLDPEPPDPAPLLAALPSPLQPAQLHGLCFVAQRRYRLRCNWKVAVENYLDGGYHVPVLHRELAAGLDLESYHTQICGAAVTQSVRARPGERRVGAGALYSWLNPTLMLNRYGPVLDTNRVVPRGPERSEILYDFFFEPEAARDPAFVADALAQSHAVQLEDSDICRRVQQGLRSASFSRGRYAPRFEHGAHHFHCLLARALRDALGGGTQAGGTNPA